MKKKSLAGNTNTGLLKAVAVLFMVMDHCGKLFFPAVPEMRLLGRIAFPLFAWGIVIGCEYTKDIQKYALRILLTGIISQPLYILALHHQWNDFSVFVTLLLGVIAILGIKNGKFGSEIWAPIICLAATAYLKADYGWKGVALILLLWACRKSRGALAAVMAAFCLFWGQGTASVSSLFGLRLQAEGVLEPVLNLVLPVLRIQFFAILALPFMLIESSHSWKTPKWLGYAIYPAHLAVLYLIQIL